MKLERDMQYIKRNLTAHFQLNMSKHVGEKCGKLRMIYFLNSKRGITPSKIDTKGQRSKVICSTLN